MTKMTILVKNGSYNDFMTLSLIASGAIATDFEVNIFAMNDAVWALRKDMIGMDRVVHSEFPEFSDKVSNALNEDKIIPWWQLLEDLKDMGELTITVCALVADVVGLHIDDFSPLVDEIAGVANFAAEVDDSDFVMTI